MEIDCPLTDDCVLIRRTLDGHPDVAILMRARYCDRDGEACALRKIAVAIGPEHVPVGLYPNQTGRAELIIWKEYQKKRSSGEVPTEGPA